MRLPFAILLLLCSTCAGQIVGQKSFDAGEPVSFTLTIAPDSEHVLTASCQFLQPEVGRIYASPIPGKHWIADSVTTKTWETRDVLVPGPKWPDDPKDVKRETLRNLVDKTTVEHRHDFVVAGHGPQPPPGPDPPTPTPTPEGKRHVVIIRETEDTTDALARVTTGLRVGEQAKWLKDRGHTLRILDDDDLPSDLKAKLGVLPPLPALFVIDAANGAVIYADQLHAENAAAVIALVK